MLIIEITPHWFVVIGISIGEAEIFKMAGIVKIFFALTT